MPRKSSLASFLYAPGRASLRFFRVGVLGVAVATGTMVGCGGGDDAAEVAEAPDDAEGSGGSDAARRGPSAGGAAAPSGGGDNNAASGQNQQASRGPTTPGGGGNSGARRGPTMPGGGGGNSSARRGPSMPGGGGGARRGPSMPGGGGSGLAGGQPGGGGGAGFGGAPQIQGPPPRPEDFAQWTAEHFRDSVRERDAKAEDAVKWLGENKPDDATAGLLVEMLALLNEPAKEPPAGARGGSPRGGGSGGGRRGPAAPGGGRRGPSAPGAPPAGESGGAGGAVAQLDDAVLKQTILAAIRGNLSSTLLTSVVMQAGQQGYPGGGQNGPPAGYPGGGGSQEGPPEGYPGGGGGMQEGYPGAGGQEGYPGGDGMQEGYPGAGGMQEGYPGAGGGQQGYPGAGQGSSSGYPGGAPSGGLAGGSNPGSSAGGFGHYGTMNVDEFIKTTVMVLLKLDTPKAWDAVDKMLAGSFELPMEGPEVSNLVLGQLISGYGGENHPSHSLITDTMQGTNRDTLLTTLTGYAITSADRLLGLNGTSAVTGPQRGRRGFGGGGSRGPGFPGDPSGGAGNRFPGAPGAGGGNRFPGAPGAPGGNGQNSPPPPAGAPLTMASSPKVLGEGEDIKKITSLLFSEDLGARVAAGLSNAGTPADVPQLLALASSLPNTAVRRAQYQMLNNARKQGPQNLIDAGFFTKVAHDPGLLVTLKSMPRARGESLVQKQWDDAHKGAVLAFRNRLKLAAASAGALSVPKPTPVTLHKGYSGHVAAAFQKKWPRDIGSMIGGVEPGLTEVQYIRMEVPEPDKNGKMVLDHYKKGSKTSDEYDTQSQLYWFSRLRDIRNSPLKRSVDVIVTQGRGAGGGGAGAAAGGGAGAGFAGGGGGGGSNNVIVVEVISVITANPKDSGVTNASLNP